MVAFIIRRILVGVVMVVLGTLVFFLLLSGFDGA